MGNVVTGDVRNLIDKELAAAQKIYGLRASFHEKYSVMLEEVEEARQELDEISCEMYHMWNCVKRDDYENAARFASRIQYTAERLACEAIQVAAMAKKEVKKK